MDGDQETKRLGEWTSRLIRRATEWYHCQKTHTKSNKKGGDQRCSITVANIKDTKGMGATSSI